METRRPKTEQKRNDSMNFDKNAFLVMVQFRLKEVEERTLRYHPGAIREMLA